MKPVLFFGAIIFATGVFAQRVHNSSDVYLKGKKKKIEVVLQAADFRPNDVIVDIGSGEGWFDVALGIHADSLHFYLEDIDSSFIKSGKLQEAITSFSKFRTAPMTCTYVQNVGSNKSTNLPGGHFDKVLLIDTFHHLNFRDEMIAEMQRIMKESGKLVLFEAVARKRGEIFKSCHSVIYEREEIINAFTKNGFVLDRVYKTVNGNRVHFRVFTFRKGFR